MIHGRLTIALDGFVLDDFRTVRRVRAFPHRCGISPAGGAA